ncbi:MAG: hypothetical protein ACLSG9_11935 [Eubacterium sp.]
MLYTNHATIMAEALESRPLETATLLFCLRIYQITGEINRRFR